MTDFSIEPGPGADREVAVDATLGILSRWAGDDASPIDAADLLGGGRRELVPTHDALRKYTGWTHLSSPRGDWVTRLDVVTVNDDGSRFTARVSIGELNGVLRLRLGLAREVAAAGLSPIADPHVRQPHVLANLVEHPGLRVSSSGQLVDGSYLQARGAEQAALVGDALRVQHRLPVLLVHTRTKEASQATRRAAAGLIGLVRVVTVDLPTGREILAQEPRARVPYAGGLLVWSDLSVPATVVGEDIVNAQDHDALRASVMAQVAPLSVLTRGSDEVYRAVREAGRISRADDAAARTAAAVESGEQTAIIEALTQERDQLQTDLSEAMTGWSESDTRSRELATEAARWKATAEQLQIAQRYAGATTVDEASEQGVDEPPEISTGDTATLSALIDHLATSADGRLVFTDSAYTSWKKADRYPTPDEMQIALIKLAQVARDLYDGSDRSVGHMGRWIRENYDLKVSLQDDQMPKAFRTFTFEGVKYDRTPHVKVNDGVPHHECGRVYFAFDQKNERIIVDHVGLKY
ncbi:hypothetical protein J1G44_02360 [Cellulomonas sp. zg-ZUI199]|uniref:Uncharacterized protein n=1 Tax=Cellulomonas wangleii TaxID=2816956 RepID=A0ABX8D6J6_9CELL|nr:hypothetical protein [Cellulomonas wangleii]MBO0923325.1 hypothetical protein [Cellulomonas wangleii]QVI61682.1 hypothetical protein KG103_14645 [Cellulomonas wangleii]